MCTKAAEMELYYPNQIVIRSSNGAEIIAPDTCFYSSKQRDFIEWTPKLGDIFLENSDLKSPVDYYPNL